MPITHDYKTDYWYKKGLKEGAKEIVVNMLRSGLLTISQIASLAHVSEEYVLKIKKKENIDRPDTE